MMVKLSRTLSILSLVLFMNCFSRNQARSMHHLRSHFSRKQTDPKTESITTRQSNEEGMRRNTFRELMDMMHSINEYLRRINSRQSRRWKKLKHTSLENVLATSLNPATSSLKSTTSSLKPAISSLNPASSSLKPAISSLNRATSSIKSATSSLKSDTSSLNPAHELFPEVYSPASKNLADVLNIASGLQNPFVSSRNPTGFSQNPALSSQNRAVSSKRKTLVSQNPVIVSLNPTDSSRRLAKEHSTLVPKRNFTKIFKSISKTFRAKRFRIRHFKMQYGNNRPFDRLASGLIG